jgi:hypothetical protein
VAPTADAKAHKPNVVVGEDGNEYEYYDEEDDGK